MTGVRHASIALCLILSAASAWAEPSKEERARAAELKKKGDELVHASQFREALEAYDASYAIVQDPAILYNRGRALQNLGEFVQALEALETFMQSAPPELKAKVPNLPSTMEDIAHHIATLEIQCSVEGATVTINGKTVGTTPLSSPVKVNAGDVSVEVKADGYLPFQVDRDVPGGETTTIEANLKQVVKSAPVPEPEPDTTPPPPETPAGSSRGWRTVTIASGAVGLASLTTGMIFFGLALSDKGTVDAHCPMKACDRTGRAALDEAQTFATVSTIFVITGAIGLATAATTFIITPKGAPVQAALRLEPGFAVLGGVFR